MSANNTADADRRGPPRFTIVVPVHDIGKLLRDSLDSLTSQSFPRFEVVAVDDGSTDESPRLLDEYARSDPRIRVLRHEQNRGLGPARNTGLDAAEGEYVLFVDADDALAPDALESIDRRIRTGYSPDLVVFHYAHWYPPHHREVNAVNVKVFCRAPLQTLDVSSYPELLELKPAATTRAHRRSFLEQHGFRFTPGLYEDTPWGYSTLLLADTVSLLDEVCYLYRQDRPGRLLGTSDRRHFDVFDQWQEVAAFLSSHPDLDRWRHQLTNVMGRQFLRILREGRVPRHDRREFFRRACDQYRMFSENHTAAGRGSSRGLGLLHRGSYPQFLLWLFRHRRRRRRSPSPGPLVRS